MNSMSVSSYTTLTKTHHVSSSPTIAVVVAIYERFALLVDECSRQVNNLAKNKGWIRDFLLDVLVTP